MISKVWIRLSLLAGVLMVVVSAAGLFTATVYEKEHISWAAQGFGQDVINVFLVFPALLVCVYFIRKNSLRAVLVWLGLLVYMTYSYVLYAFFMHFGSWFLVYIATLSLSFYTLIGSSLEVLQIELSSKNSKGISVYLFVNGVMFGLLWLIEIIPRLFDGVIPKSAVDVGLAINPVHVMDLGFLLPAMIVVSFSLWKNGRIGYVFAASFSVFAIIMATAILSMIAVMNIRGVTETWGAAPLMIINIIVGIYISCRFLMDAKIINNKI
jgi:hypothetical protein